MKTVSRLATLGVLALMPTAVSIVAPIGTVDARVVPGPPVTTEHALEAPGTVSPAAEALGAADDAEARVLADDRAVSVKAATSSIAVPEDLAVVGITWREGTGEGASVQYRTRKDGSWGAWAFVAVDEGHQPEPAEVRAAKQRGRETRSGTAPVALIGADQVQVRVIAPTSGAAPQDSELVIIDPGEPSTEATSGLAPGSAVAAVQQPYIYTRAQWGADESWRDPDGPTYAEVKAAFVHHTVGTNDYSQDQVPGILQGIYDYHVHGRGWADVGYNFFVDRFGRTWEGRYGGIDLPVQGAHAVGVNDDAFGVAVLGNYHPDNDPPPGTPPAATSVPNAVTNALVALISWKAEVHGFNPAGTSVLDGVSYPGVNGHRDAEGNSTECPGDVLYAKLPEIRKAAGEITDGSGKAAERWSGADRYQTAAVVSASTFPNGAPVAFVATGADFPDALAGGPAGARLGGPMLLTAKDTLPESTYSELQRLKPQKIHVLGGSGVVSDAVASRLATLAPVTRIAGPDRFATAAQASAQAFPTGAPVAFVATGMDFPDALAGGPAADQLGGPMLLSSATSLPGPTVTELERLEPSRIVVLGGSSAVSDAVVSQIYSATGVMPERWSAADRYATAATASAKAFPTGTDVVFVSTGSDFPDALAGGPAGGTLGAPLLLTGRDTLPQATITELKRLTPSRIVVLGGSGVVSSAVTTQLRSYLS